MLKIAITRVPLPPVLFCILIIATVIFVPERQYQSHKPQIISQSVFANKDRSVNIKLPTQAAAAKIMEQLSPLQKAIFLVRSVGETMPGYLGNPGAMYLGNISFPQDHLDRRYGNCSNRAVRMKSFASQLGLQARIVSTLHDYIPGHAFNIVEIEGKSFILDTDHSLIIEPKSDGTAAIHLLPLTIKYFLPSTLNGRADWNSASAFFDWVEHIREGRWVRYIGDVGFQHLLDMPEGSVFDREKLNTLRQEAEEIDVTVNRLSRADWRF